MTQTVSAPTEPQAKSQPVSQTAIAVYLPALGCAVARLARIATDRPKHKELANILIKCEGDRLWLTACDLKVFSQVSLKIDNPQGENWEMLLPARLLNDLLKMLPAEYWFLTPKPRAHPFENLPLIELANSPQKPTSRYLLNAFAQDDFPRVPDMESPSLSFEVEAEKLRQAIASVKPAAAMPGKIGNHRLQGIYLQVQGDRLQLSATDGHRLATEFVDGKTIKTEEVPGLLITHDFANQLCDRTLPNIITLHFNSECSWIEADGTRIVSQLSKEEFPFEALSKYFDRPSEWDSCAEKRLLRKALQRLKPLTKKGISLVTVESCETDQVVTISCGDGKEQLPAQVKRSSRALFRIEYLEKAIACLDATEILFTLTPGMVCYFGVLGSQILLGIMPVNPPKKPIQNDADPETTASEKVEAPPAGTRLAARLSSPSGHMPTKEPADKCKTPTPVAPTPPVQSEDQVRILVRFKRPWLGFGFQPAWVGFSLEGRSWEVRKPGKKWMSKLQSQIVSLDEKEAIAELVVPQSELEFWKIAA